MRFSLGCEIGYDIAEQSTLIFNIEAMNGGRQDVISENLQITPFIQADYNIAEDTGNRYRRLIVNPCQLTLRYDAEVELRPLHAMPDVIDEVPVSQLPLDILPYLNPSRYCPSDQLARFAARQFGHMEPGHNRVTTICNWIHEEVDYISGASDTSTTAADTFSMRAGVCRDFAHLGITFCRALGIPARFASCYAWQLEPQDFHAVFEAYLGDRWYLFDATRMAALDGLVRIGCGRDAADTAFSTIYGNVNPLAMRVWIKALNADPTQEWTTEAVSLAKD
ncbi:transglutaminase family protein [Devosia sp.]|uniref:transglutaminase-like domain-containing protein n=1 Tax=Devosia sp. TaxID=1871048 RepID=UPI003262E617